MSIGRIEQDVERLALPIAQTLGYELVGVEFVRQPGADNELLVYIDKPGGVDLDDCEKMSRALDEPLDEADPIPSAYVLCVSSPGLDRPLKTDRDLQREMGKDVEVRLFVKQDGKKEFVGALTAWDENTLTIDCAEGPRSFERKQIALVRLHIDFGGLQ